MRLAFAVLAFLVAGSLWPVASTFVRDWTAVDACLDAGGSFDYWRARCDPAASHPYVPFRSRHADLVAEASVRVGGIAALGLVLAVGHYARQHRVRRPAV